jgi:alkyl hydroperoxide reductase subunit AhpF
VDRLKDELRKRLERDLVRDVGLTPYVGETQTSKEVVSILEDIASLSDKIKLDEEEIKEMVERLKEK